VDLAALTYTDLRRKVTITPDATGEPFTAIITRIVFEVDGHSENGIITFESDNGPLELDRYSSGDYTIEFAA